MGFNSVKEYEEHKKRMEEFSEETYLITRRQEWVSEIFPAKRFGFKKNRKCNNAKRPKPRKKSKK